MTKKEVSKLTLELFQKFITAKPHSVWEQILEAQINELFLKEGINFSKEN